MGSLLNHLSNKLYFIKVVNMFVFIKQNKENLHSNCKAKKFKNDSGKIGKKTAQQFQTNRREK